MLKFKMPSARTSCYEMLNMFISRKLQLRKLYFKRYIISMDKERANFEIRLYSFTRQIYPWIVGSKEVTEVVMLTGSI